MTEGITLWLDELRDSRTGCPPVRLPWTGNVPTTPRLRTLIDTLSLQRLRGVAQLGMGYLVYPGAVHTRFEHSLGTYDMARRLILHLVRGGGSRWLTEEDVTTFLVAALLHDVGHYPFSHTLEELPRDDTGRVELQRHDRRARDVILNDELLVQALRREWGVDPERVVAIIDEEEPPQDEPGQRLAEMLSGPLNPDRLDYLQRDSAHTGVPYGQVIDVARLLETVTFTEDGRRLGVSPKGVSAVETLIFASYLMYREVYWHHTVRSAQAMLKRATTDLLRGGALKQEELLDLNDAQAMALLHERATGGAAELLHDITGPGRKIYRRVFDASMANLPESEVFARIREGNYWSWDELGREICRSLARAIGQDIPEHALLIDVAGQGKELFFSVPVLSAGNVTDTSAPEVSLIAPWLSRNFDEQAKRVLILAPAHLVEDFRRHLGLGDV